MILNYFGVKFRYHRGVYSFPCPIHGGSGYNCRISPNKQYCNWVCWSNRCEEECGKTIYGFICGLMKQENPEANKMDAVNFCLDFLKLDEDKLNETSHNIDRSNFVSMVREQGTREKNKRLFSRKKMRERLNIPSSYFVNRGYSPEILDKYDVGFCHYGSSDMRDRVLFPIYDDNHEFVIGTVGRTLKPRCDKCGQYHEYQTGCPTSGSHGKWKNSFDFEAGNVLFNYWFAKEPIRKSQTVILVEGQGDVLKVEQAGIHNSLGIFGTSLKEGQQKKLQELGVMSVILALDADKAGEKANKKIESQLRRYYNLYRADIPEGKDVGDLTEEEIRSIFEPILKKVNYESTNISY